MRELHDRTLSETVSALTGIPVGELHDAGSLLRRLPDIEAALQARLIGQERAVGVVLAALRARLLRQSATRPILNCLCVGPSGVGKTELARQLARTCLGNPEALVRIDGSEYREAHSLARLIGAPPGYVGHGPGQLTEAVRRRPRSVVLFDEAEKAAPEVLNVLLQIMSAGRLTDATGATVDFRQAMVLLTSNLGNTPTRGRLPERAAYEEQVLSAVSDGLPPELLGRLDATVVFHHLNEASLEAVVRLKLADNAEALSAVASFEPTAEVVTELALEAWSPDSGARQVDRVLQRRVDPAVAQMIEQGLLEVRRPLPVRIALEDGEFVFSRG